MNINFIFKYKKSLNNQIFKIIIYDSNNKLILNDYTDHQGHIKCQLSNQTYKIYILANNKNIKCQKLLTISINKNTPKNMIFVFDNISTSHQIKIRLKDLYYPELPIEKGTINLWQKNT